jgi:superfamily II DNA/RNA helicase
MFARATHRFRSSNDLAENRGLLKGIYKMGYQKPSKIQEKALPLLLQNPLVLPKESTRTPPFCPFPTATVRSCSAPCSCESVQGLSLLANANKLCSHPNLLKGIYKMGYQKPSKIQEKALVLPVPDCDCPIMFRAL